MRVEEFLDLLDGARPTGQDRWQARCPAHADRTPSLSVAAGLDGRTLVHCFAGCTTEEIAAAVGLTTADLFADDGNGSAPIDATYRYTDEAGKVLYEVVRYWPKKFLQRRPDGAGDWIWKLGDVRRVLYRLPEVVAAVKAGEPVVVVEGEKDVHAIEGVGRVATCNAGGAGPGKWRSEYSEPLRGARVAVVADADEPGRRHAREVSESLSAVAAKVTVLEPPEAEDISAHLAKGGKLGELVELGTRVETEEDEPEPEPAPNTPAHSTLTDFTEIAAKRVRFLLPDRVALGKITGLVGRPKIGKGLFYTRLIADTTNGDLDGDLDGPRRAIIVTTEDDPGDTLKPRLIAAGADLSKVAYFQMGSREEPSPFRVPDDADELGRRVAETEAALVVVDPLVEFIDGKIDTHKSQPTRQAIASLNRIARDHGCAVLAVFHLNKGASTDPLIRQEASAAFLQVVRTGLLIGFDPDDPDAEEGDRRVLAVSSSNLAKLAPSLLLRIDGCTIAGDNGEPIGTARIECIGESTAASHELLRGREDDETRADQDEAVEFLEAELGEGDRPAQEVGRAAVQAGIGPGALKRAKRRLGVESNREGFGGKGGWIWRLPPKGTPHVSEKPSPLSPLGSRAKNRPSEGGKTADAPSPLVDPAYRAKSEPQKGAKSPKGTVSDGNDAFGADSGAETGCPSHPDSPVAGCRYCQAKGAE